MDSTKQNTICNTDNPSNLVSRYREALKSGDKNFAKSCLMSTTLSSINDPNITNEIYLMAKTHSDVDQASLCFTNLFQSLYANNNATDTSVPTAPINRSMTVTNHLKEETRLLLTELKSQYLHVKSTHNSSNSNTRRTPSACQSPLLSPRSRMSSEDRSMSKDPMLKGLNAHLNNTNKSLFYQQLYENLTQEMRRELFLKTIDNTDNPFERCRLMMLAITLSNETAVSIGPKLSQTLMELSETNSEKTTGSEKITSTRPPSMCFYAKSMLVLDTIPLIFSIERSMVPDLDLDELFQRTFSYYSESCLDNLANEFEFDELHEGLKKSIAARILGKEINTSPDDSFEDNIVISIECLFNRFIQGYSHDPATFETLKEIRDLIAGRDNKKLHSIDQIKDLIVKLELEPDIPESILFLKGKDYSTSGPSQASSASTPPPKARGRPKKSQASVIVSSDDGVRRHLQSKSKEALFVFYSILQHMFNQCSQYLRQTRSRILINFDNPLASDIESEMVKSQRSSRSKGQANSETGSGSKRIKTEHQPNASKSIDFDASQRNRFLEDSPLNAEQSRKVDLEVYNHLKRVQECLEFFKSSPTITRLWQRFLSSSQCDKLRWFSRIHAECLMLSNDIEQAIVILDEIVHCNQDERKIKKEASADSELSTLTVTTGSMPSVEVIHLRALAQLISCYGLTSDKQMTLDCMEKLMARIKQSGLLTNDENYSSGNIIDEYKMLFAKESKDDTLGFLFFDALSLIRYVVDVLMSILTHHVAHPSLSSDTVIGHTIVLSQIDWPKESYIYDRCIAWIRVNKPTSTTPHCLSALTKFTYTDFFNYVLNPNILEDFTALLNNGYTLDIKGSQPVGMSTSDTHEPTQRSSARTGKAITTRGVNKTFKEVLKVALIAQMKNSTNLIPLGLITEFVQTTLIPHLKAGSTSK